MLDVQIESFTNGFVEEERLELVTLRPVNVLQMHALVLAQFEPVDFFDAKAGVEANDELCEVSPWPLRRSRLQGYELLGSRPGSCENGKEPSNVDPPHFAV